ncbi:MAG: bestrophin family ion channel [Rubripirellula sp.]|nr:bestrophin family ion channel [Rubripirellula sp.]
MDHSNINLPKSNNEPLEEPRPLTYSFWLGALTFGASAVPRVLLDIFKFGLIAFVVVLLSSIIKSRWEVSLLIPSSLLSATGAVLGLLLVLRTNAGYDRWWEARKLWGGIVNQSRNLAIVASAYGPPNGEWRNQFIRWTAVLPHVIRCSLRDESALPAVARLVGKANAQRIAETSHMPTFVSSILGQMLSEGRHKGMSRYAFLQAEQQRSMIVDHLGGCERIRNTPLARSSAILVRQLIFIFLVALPFALLSEFDGPATFEIAGIGFNSSLFFIPLLIMLLAMPMLSLDRIGMELQNPFDTRRIDHLPLDAICHTIEKNLMEVLKNDPVATEEGLVLETIQLDPELAAIIAKGNNRDTLIS